MKHKLLSIWLATLFSMVASVASAYDVEIDGIYYNLNDDGTASVTRGDVSYAGAVEIPESFKYGTTAYRVTSIDRYAFMQCLGLTSVSIPNGVLDIGYAAFDNCVLLDSINIPSSVVTISDCAFSETGITYVYIPGSITSMGQSVFWGCKKLATIEIDEDLTTLGRTTFDGTLWYENQPDGVLYVGHIVCGYKGTMPANTAIELKEGTRGIGEYAFGSFSNLRSISIPTSMNFICKGAFSNCTNLRKAEFGSLESLCRIKFDSSDANPLYYAHSLYINGVEEEELIIPKDVTKIGAHAFTGMSNLSSLSIPENIVSIGEGAFTGCTNLTAVLINSDSIASQAFTYDNSYAYTVKSYTLSDIFGNQVTHYTFGDAVSSIGANACRNATKLKYVNLGINVISIGTAAFRDCTNISQVEFASIERLCSIKFNDGDSNPLSKAHHLYINGKEITEVVVPDGVDTIGDYAFNRFTELKAVTLPESLTSIGRFAFGNCQGLTTITLPEGLTSIGTSAFYNCTGLTSINIPEGVTAIKSYTFEDCNGLMSVKLPDRITSISDYAFKGCTGLTEIHLPDSLTLIAQEAFQGCSNLTNITIPNYVTKIGLSAFSGCSNLTNITINSDSIASVQYDSKSTLSELFGKQVTHYTFGGAVRTIGDYACYNLENLKAVTIEDSVTTICRGAFRNCQALLSVSIGKGMSFVGRVAFSECTNLKKAEFASIESLCGITFEDESSNPLCEADLYINGEEITSVIIPEGITSIGNYAFANCDDLSSVSMPGSLNTIGKGAFYNCSDLTTVTIPNNVTLINGQAFRGCNSLTSVEIGSNVAHFGGYVFEKCPNLTNVIINSDSIASRTYTSSSTLSNIFGSQVTHYAFGDSVKAIGKYACYGLETLDSITLGNNLRSIGDYAFAGCKKLTSVTLPDNLLTISQGAFMNCSNLTTASFGESVRSVGSRAFENCDNLEKAEFASLQSLLGIDFDVSFSRWGDDFTSNPLDHATLYINGETVTDIVVPETVTSIGSGVFAGYSALKSITMGDNVEAIGYGAFASCSNLDSVVIGNHVKSIGQYAFANCYRIASITIGDNVSYIGSDAFYNCSKLTDVTINSDSIASKSYYNAYSIKGLSNIFGTQVTHYTFGGAVRAIGDYACYNLENLKAVTIGDSVKAVGEYAFRSTGLEKAEFESIGSLCDIEFANESSNPLYWAQHLFVNGEELTEVVIPEGVTAIKKYAFIDCVGLTSLSIPESVTSIGEGAFYYCTGLTSISIPNGVTTIGKNAFNNCTGLTSAYIGSSVASFGTSPFYGCTALTDVTINSNAIASKTYSSSSRLSNIFGTQVTNYTFGDSVTAIGDYACYNLTKLNSVVLGDNVASLGQYAFSGCTGLTSMELPDNMTSIGTRAFGGCTGLTEIAIGKEMNAISDGAFYGCSNMKSVTINSNPLASQTYSESYTLANLFGNQVSHYTFGDGVQTIGAYACSNLTNLNVVTLSESVDTIGANAFLQCTGLTMAEYASMERACQIWYGSAASNPLFNAHHLYINGEEVTEVDIPETVSTIEWFAFGGCTGLTSVTIPNNVTKIEGWAFHGCSSLSNVEIPNSVTYLGKGALAECANLKSVSLSENLDSIAYATFASCSSLTSIIIPDKVHSIGQQAFQLCRKLTNISIPDSVSFIDYGAFANSGLTSVSIPKSVKSLGAAVFFSCLDLKTLVVYSDGLSMNSSIFAYCSSLNEIVSTGRLNMTVPDSSTVLVPSALVTDMQAKYQNATVLPLESTDATQTTVSLSSATEHFKVLDATMDGTEVQVNEGVVKLTGCTPANSYTVNVAGEAFGLPVSIPLAVMTEGLSLAINAKEATNTTLTVQGSYDAGDATVTYAGFDGYEAGNEATVTGLRPGEATSFTYRVKTDDGSEFTVTQDLTTKPITIVGETISKTATSVVLKGKLEDLIDVAVESMGFEDSDYESDELTLTGLTPNTTYSRHFKVTLADGGEAEADIEFTTEELTLTTQLPKVVNEGQVILTALSNLDDSETEIGFEWRRQDWSDDFNSKYADAHLFGGTMEGYINNMNVMFLWKYRPYYTAADGTTYYGDWKGIDPTDYSHFDPTVYTYAANSMEEGTVEIKGYAQCGSDEIASQGFKYWTGTEDMPVDATSVEADGTVMTATLIDLLSATTYSYVAYVTTTKGETFYGERQTFQTGGADATIMLQTWDDEVTDDVEAIYDLNGRRIAKVQRGVNIIRYTDGTTRKVRVK